MHIAYCNKVTKVTNPISDFTFLSTAKSGKSRIKNPFLDSPKGTHPQYSIGTVELGKFLHYIESSSYRTPRFNEFSKKQPKCSLYRGTVNN